MSIFFDVVWYSTLPIAGVTRPLQRGVDAALGHTVQGYIRRGQLPSHTGQCSGVDPHHFFFLHPDPYFMILDGAGSKGTEKHCIKLISSLDIF